MHLFTVILPLAIQAAVIDAVPPGVPTKYAYQRDVDHNASLTASTVRAAPTAGIYNRDFPPDIADTTVAHRIPLMPPLDQPCATTTSTALKSIKSLAPLLDRVLVQRIKAQTQTAGGIFLPESSVKELNEARVLAVGPGGLDKEGKIVKPSVKAGDKVLIPQYGGSPVKVGEEEYALFRDYELLAKINE
ncbi:hypothetical protein VE00_04456 [Pseudogymnoascus sp. WSF 3629]|nr:hypothetical protein VE00_04456 [Pseudogymnoascus sp. WSF 3629]